MLVFKMAEHFLNQKWLEFYCTKSIIREFAVHRHLIYPWVTKERTHCKNIGFASNKLDQHCGLRKPNLCQFKDKVWAWVYKTVNLQVTRNSMGVKDTNILPPVRVKGTSEGEKPGRYTYYTTREPRSSWTKAPNWKRTGELWSV